MMTHQEPETHDTHLMPVMFADGTDRRSWGRVPFETSVRVGPPYGAPYATVRAYDLSGGGIFIRSVRPAEVGSTFSVELTLPNEQTIYIPEAEVLYNRTQPEIDLAGFAAKFTSLTDEVAAVIESGAVFPSDVMTPDGGIVSLSMITDKDPEYRTNSPRPVTSVPTPRVSDLRISIPELAHDTEIVDRNDTERPIEAPSFGPSAAPEAVTSTLPSPEPVLDSVIELEEETPMAKKVRNRRPLTPTGQLRRRARRRARQNPLPWALLISGGLVGLAIAAGLARSGSSSDKAEASAVTVRAPTRGIRSDTQAILSGRDSVDTAVPALVAPKKKAEVVPAPKKVVKAEPAKAVPAPKKEQAKKAEPKKVVKGSAKLVKPAEAPAPAASKHEVSVGVASATAIMKKAILHNPPRLMLDLITKGQPQLPAARADLGIRVGEHPGFTRIVFDAKRPIRDAFAAVRNGKLNVKIEY